MKNFLKYIFFLVVSVFDRMAKSASNVGEPKQKIKNQQRICLVKVDGIGDCIILLKVFESVYNHYKNKGYKISLITAKPCRELYEERWSFENIYELKLKDLYRFKYRYQTIKGLSHLRFDAVVNLAYSRTISIDSLVGILTSNIKVGNAGDCGNTPKLIKNHTDKIYTNLAPVSDGISEHQHNVDFLKWLDIEVVESTELKGVTTESNRDKYFVLFPGASNYNKCWDIEKIINVAMKTSLVTGWYVVICGGKNDVILSNRIKDVLTQNHIKVEEQTGKTSLSQTAEIVKNSEVVITNDTSGVHFANLYNIPNVCIARGCDVGRFIDARDDNGKLINENHIAIYHSRNCKEKYKVKCLRQREVLPCIAEISCEEVLEGVMKLIVSGEKEIGKIRS